MLDVDPDDSTFRVEVDLAGPRPTSGVTPWTGRPVVAPAGRSGYSPFRGDWRPRMARGSTPEAGTASACASSWE